jgi:hypothetical protein
MNALLKYLKVIIVVLIADVVGLSFLSAQNFTNSAAVKLDDQILVDLSTLDANILMWKSNTLNEAIQTTDEMILQQAKALRPLKDGIRYLRLKNEDTHTNRIQLTVSWLAIFEAIDKHMEINISPVSIGGYIYPPAGYKGKVGPFGMEEPSTNNAIAHAYYVAMVKRNMENYRKLLFHQQLEILNNIYARSGFEQFLKSYYSSSGADEQEFALLLKNSQLSAGRKQDTLNLFDRLHKMARKDVTH